MRVKFLRLLLALYIPVTVIIIIFFKYDTNKTFERVFRITTKSNVDEFSNQTLMPKMNQSHKLYYFKKKDLFTSVDITQLALLPKEDPISDRLANQLMYMPPNYEKYSRNLTIDNYKKIYLDNGPDAFYDVKYGTTNFKDCPVYTCNIIKKIADAHLVVYKHRDPQKKVNPDQIHMVYILESPYHYGNLNGPFDWTSTYRRDSDIVAPYGQWEYYDRRVTQLPQRENYASGKTKKVAWFVSNCHAQNNRLEYAKELNKTISVDIYGACGTEDLDCPRNEEEKCLQMLEKDYKFYLAFENSNCRDYVTEKVFLNSLQRNILPIVMGANAEDYQKMLPDKSFIHVDDFETAAHLGAYLNLLDQDDALYNSYFKWKGTGEFIAADYWCRVCAMIHIPNKDKSKYSLSDVSFREWWQGKGVCTSKRRKSKKKAKIKLQK
ncbi:glycoprotein 3-alpha-L-fucosyltransferase A-like [Culicoides brevitarsis]|uniref:glycoprotein 3-alpha-L-fucosyltransferase A-like n=1 Tax=Culicoides brevitarsis TaxID=469753 RepID=UPI00307C1064